MSRTQSQMSGSQSQSSHKSYLALNRFAIESFKILSNREKRNVVYSPISLALALGMAMTGTRGNTLSQLCNLLLKEGLSEAGIDKLEATLDKFIREFGQTSSEIKTSGGDAVNIANMIYVAMNFHLRDGFNQMMSAHFGVKEARQVDFTSQSGIDTMNSDISNVTRGKINQMFSEPLDPQTVCVLVNAIHFKGLWNYQFDKSLTRSEKFTMDDGETQQVDLMFQSYEERRDIKWTECQELNARALSLTYQGSGIKMLIILPNPGTPIGEVEKKLTMDIVKSLYGRMRPTRGKIKLWLPRFKIESTFGLVPILQEMGVNDLFQRGKADFSGLAKEPLFVSEVFQKAIIEVNEQGTEAAAATAIMVALCSIRIEPEPILFRCDRPFIYMLKCVSK